ncbi:hypothetical protein K466DRAFT_370995 [Polyporus arcularius HHB13444]|uniref:Uncharacterized protein n=1 Tax=Polyporus arcularius HHB13444 TaxID=1314778 RepID=A0A5C3PX88_9APHY|nr:hypothetical protein K466DRAFT_370995 [Polyporus arcularius HHB13444]
MPAAKARRRSSVDSNALDVVCPVLAITAPPASRLLGMPQGSRWHLSPAEDASKIRRPAFCLSILNPPLAPCPAYRYRIWWLRRIRMQYILSGSMDPLPARALRGAIHLSPDTRPPPHPESLHAAYSQQLDVLAPQARPWGRRRRGHPRELHIRIRDALQTAGMR